MSDRDTIVIMDEEYNIGDTDEKVQGLSIIIDGSFKMVLDKILCNNPQFGSYEDLIREAVYLGLIEVINKEVNPVSQYNEQHQMSQEFNETEYEEIPFEEFEILKSMAKESNIEYYD